MLYHEKGAARRLHVATVAMQCDREPVKNRAKIVETVDAIMQTYPDTELVLFGEMILGWYWPERIYLRQISETIPGETTQVLGELAAKHRIYLSFGISEVKEEAWFNAQVLLNPQGGIQAIHRKWNLKPDERNAGYQPGPTPVTVTDIQGIRVGMIICSDAASTRTMSILMRAHLDLIINSLADDRDEAWFVAKANARLYDAWIVSANRYGQENHYWNGHLVISDPMGRLRLTSLDQERCLVYELKFDAEQTWRKRLVRCILVKAPLPVHVLKHWKIFRSYFP